MIDLEKLKSETKCPISYCECIQEVKMQGPDLAALIEALECAVGAIEKLRSQIGDLPDYILDRTCRDAQARISALIGKGEGNGRQT
jgi:hypothetical protein